MVSGSGIAVPHADSNRDSELLMTRCVAVYTKGALLALPPCGTQLSARTYTSDSIRISLRLSVVKTSCQVVPFH